MKKNLLLPLAAALASAILFVGCNRDEPEPVAEPADTAVVPTDTAPADTATPPADVAATPPGGTGESTAPMPTTQPMPTATDSGRGFADLDTNKDGGVTRDELDDTEMLDQHFGDADTDGNGSLSQAEVDAHRAKMTAQPPAG